MSETLSYDLVDRLRSNIAILEHNFAALQAENGRLHNRVKELESSTFCVYCGKVSYTKEGQSKLDMMISHMAECDKHPVAGLLVEIDRLKSDKRELVEALLEDLKMNFIADRDTVIKNFPSAARGYFRCLMIIDEFAAKHKA